MSELPAITADGRRVRIGLVAALAVAQAAATALAAFATREVFVTIHAGGPLPGTALALIALAGALMALCRIGERDVAEQLGQDYAAAVRQRIFAHLARCPSRELMQRRSGALALRFVGDLAAVRGWASRGIARLISAGLVLPAATAVLFVLDPLLGLSAALPLAAGLLLMLFAGRRLRPAHDRLRRSRARLAADMSERVMQAPQLRLIGRMEAENARLTRRTGRLADAARRRARRAATLRAIADVSAGLAAAALLFATLRTGLPAATAAGALAAVGLVVQPMRDLASVWDHLGAWQSARLRCLALLGIPPLRRTSRRSPDAEIGRGPATLHLTRLAIGKGASFDARARHGERIAIVGANGAGKSSLLEVIAGLQAPASGRVRIDGLAPGALSPAQRRRTVGLYGPRSALLAGSLRRALTLGQKPRPADDHILQVALDAGLAPTLARLGGLDGRVAEGGRNLSSGELRRTLLARARLTAPQLLLLDELDDALGPDGPALVDRLVRTPGSTCLVVTQNRELVRRMDTVWFVDAGQVVEAGPAEALLAGSGPTARYFGRMHAG